MKQSWGNRAVVFLVRAGSSPATIVLVAFALIQVLVIVLSADIYARTHSHWAHRSESGASALPILINSLSAVGLSVTALGAVFTLAAAIAPRSLSVLGFGPSLKVELELANEKGCIVNWDRRLRGRHTISKAILIRFAVHNIGASAAESVEVFLERISYADGQEERKAQYEAKPARLRWSDSYDLKEFESLTYHRCPTSTESVIHSGTRHFVDFAFIFDPSAHAFYEELTVERSGRSYEHGNYWCIHPFYQWMLARDDLKVLRPDIKMTRTYFVDLLISCRNAHVKRETIEITCRSQQTLAPNTLSTASVGVPGSEKPICIKEIHLRSSGKGV